MTVSAHLFSRLLDACDDLPGDLAGKDYWAGLDLSSTTDLSAFVLVFRIDGRFAVLPFFWVPEEGARRRERRDRAPYVQWVQDELIEATPGEAIDYDRIRARINELGQTHAIRGIAIDRVASAIATAIPAILRRSSHGPEWNLKWPKEYRHDSPLNSASSEQAAAANRHAACRAER